MTDMFNQSDEFKQAIENAARLLAEPHDRRRIVHAEVDLLARAVIAMGGKLAGITLAFTEEVRKIEGDLVGALEDELEDSKSAARSWSAVKRAVAALRAKDTELRELRLALARQV